MNAPNNHPALNTRPQLLRTSGQLLLAGLALLAAAVVWDNWGDLLTAPAANTSASVPATAATLQRGQYLVQTGNCIACHTDRGQPALSGGRAIETPFGAVYSSNLTPDPATGIGRWDAQDFWQALHHGRSRSGRLLTPAFPYEHTSVITREDSDAMFVWLQSQPPVVKAPPPHSLTWPLGTQPALAVWRSLFFSPTPFVPDAQQSAEWNRGAYLVQGLGHCAACHSPRNALGATAGVSDLSGGLMPVVNWYAPNLTSDRETGLASTPLPEVVRLLRTGTNGQAHTSGPMSEVVQHSLQHLSDADVQAMAVYLKARARAAAASQAQNQRIPATVAERGLKVYDRHCATCHGEQGQGAPGIYPALAGNRAVLLGEPTNLVQALLYGGYGPATTGHPRPFGMPPFVLELDDRDIAAVLTHTRNQWGNQAGEVTPLQVNRIRAASAQ
jgi:mono/diheme cytochrome c family protein